jgi:hypothetical protein
MKKIILSFVLTFLSCSFLSAQSFNGVPLGKGIEETNQLFINKGFKPLRSVNGIKYLTGSVAGDKYEIGLVYTPISKKVWKIVVYTMPVYTWSVLKYQHAKFKEILTRNYGEPTSDFWHFSSPYYEGDGFELQAIRKGALISAVFFRDDKGNHIYMELESYQIGQGQVCVSYENSVTQELNKAETIKLENSSF